MRKVDIIIRSALFRHTTRMEVDLRPHRVEKRMYYTARIIDSTDPNVRQYDTVKISPETLGMLERSRVDIIASDGSPLRTFLKQLLALPDTTWICVGRVEVRDDYLLYIPEATPDAVVVHLIDFDLSRISLYIPDVRARELEIYIIDSDVMELRDASGSRRLAVRTPMIVYAAREVFDYSHCRIATCEAIFPRHDIALGTLIYEGSIGPDRHYVRFVPAVTRDTFLKMMQGWRIVEVFGIRSREDLEKIGIDIRELLLGASYWRDAALAAESSLRELLGLARQLGIESLTARVEQTLDNIRTLHELGRQLRISFPALLGITTLAQKASEEH